MTLLEQNRRATRLARSWHAVQAVGIMMARKSLSAETLSAETRTLRVDTLWDVTGGSQTHAPSLHEGRHDLVTLEMSTALAMTRCVQVCVAYARPMNLPWAAAPRQIRRGPRTPATKVQLCDTKMEISWCI